MFIVSATHVMMNYFSTRPDKDTITFTELTALKEYADPLLKPDLSLDISESLVHADCVPPGIFSIDWSAGIVHCNWLKAHRTGMEGKRILDIYNRDLAKFDVSEALSAKFIAVIANFPGKFMPNGPSGLDFGYLEEESTEPPKPCIVGKDEPIIYRHFIMLLDDPNEPIEVHTEAYWAEHDINKDSVLSVKLSAASIPSDLSGDETYDELTLAEYKAVLVGHGCVSLGTESLWLLEKNPSPEVVYTALACVVLNNINHELACCQRWLKAIQPHAIKEPNTARYYGAIAAQLISNWKVSNNEG